MLCSRRRETREGRRRRERHINESPLVCHNHRTSICSWNSFPSTLRLFSTREGVRRAQRNRGSGCSPARQNALFRIVSVNYLQSTPKLFSLSKTRQNPDCRLIHTSSVLIDEQGFTRCLAKLLTSRISRLLLPFPTSNVRRRNCLRWKVILLPFTVPCSIIDQPEIVLFSFTARFSKLMIPRSARERKYHLFRGSPHA